MVQTLFALAQKIVYNALDLISTKTEENPVLVLEKAVKNVIGCIEHIQRMFDVSFMQLKSDAFEH